MMMSCRFGGLGPCLVGLPGKEHASAQGWFEGRA